MKKKYLIKWIRYDKLEFCIRYINMFLGEEEYYINDMSEDLYNDLKSGKKT